MWAATRQSQQNECAPSEDSDQPGHPPSLIRVFACAQWVAKDPSFLHADSEDSDQPGHRQWRLWSDWADAQADLSLHWAHTHFVGFVMSWLICFGHVSFCPFSLLLVSGVGCGLWLWHALDFFYLLFFRLWHFSFNCCQGYFAFSCLFLHISNYIISREKTRFDQ